MKLQKRGNPRKRAMSLIKPASKVAVAIMDNAERTCGRRTIFNLVTPLTRRDKGHGSQSRQA